MLKNAELKLDRADKHILDLEREFRAFIDGNAHSIIVEVNQDEGTVYRVSDDWREFLVRVGIEMSVDDARIFLAIRRPLGRHWAIGWLSKR